MEVDGSKKSGSGTILRLSLALAAIRGDSLHLYNIRQNRRQPGLRPQHLAAVLTAASICDAEVKGARVGSRELWFKPKDIKRGEVYASIGTAGSIPMLLLTIIPICAFADRPTHIHVAKGGTDVLHSPTINYLKSVFIPTLKQMGLTASVTVKAYGYYPKGMGEVLLTVHPCSVLRPFNRTEFGTIKDVNGISVCTFLAQRRVANRQAQAASQLLKHQGYHAEMKIVNDRSNSIQRGSSIVLWAKTSAGALLGSDAIGLISKTSEVVGQEAAEKLLKEIQAQATVDVHLADMLIPYVALATGNSAYFVRTVTEHLETNIWLVQELLGVKFSITKKGHLYRIEKR